MDSGERALRWLGIALAAWVLLAAASTIFMVRLLPRGYRLKAVPTVFLQAFFGAFPRPRWTWSRADRAAASVRVVGHVVAWNALERRTDLVADRQCVTTEGREAEVFGLDLDGSVLVCQRLPLDDGYQLYIHARDGSRTEIAHGGSHDTGWASGGSLDRGVAAWMRWDRTVGALELWRWEKHAGARVIHRLPVPARTRRAAPTGWTVVLGDVVVATFLNDFLGRVVVHHSDHGALEVAQTQLPTLHRDLVAEERGMRLVAFSIFKGGPLPNRVATVNVDVWPPVVKEIDGGYAPGASTVLGEVLGFWTKPPVLEIPADQGLSFEGGSVVDPVGDNDWVAFVLAEPTGSIRPRVPKQAVVLDGIRTQILTNRAEARVLMRGGYICWQEAEPRPVPDPGTPHPGSTTWVARLRPHVEAERPPPGTASET